MFGIFIVLLILSSCDVPSDPENKNYVLAFDGKDDKVVVFDNNDAIDFVSDQITLEAWIYVMDIQDLVGRIIDRSDNQLDDRYVIEVYLRNGTPTVHLNLNRNNLWSESIAFNKWIHVAGTYDGEFLRLYVNGVLQDSSFVKTEIDVNESNLMIGHGGPNSGYTGAFKGLIDDIFLWNIARDDKEIKKDMDKK